MAQKSGGKGRKAKSGKAKPAKNKSKTRDSAPKPKEKTPSAPESPVKTKQSEAPIVAESLEAPEAQEIKEEQPSYQAPAGRRVAKTLIETEVPTPQRPKQPPRPIPAPVAAPVLKSSGGRKVPKTLLEPEIQIEKAEDPPAPQAETPQKKARTVPKTLIETDQPLKADEPRVAEAKEAGQDEPRPAEAPSAKTAEPRVKSKGERTVPRTMMDVNVLDSIGGGIRVSSGPNPVIEEIKPEPPAGSIAPAAETQSGAQNQQSMPFQPVEEFPPEPEPEPEPAPTHSFDPENKDAFFEKVEVRQPSASGKISGSDYLSNLTPAPDHTEELPSWVHSLPQIGTVNPSKKSPKVIPPEPIVLPGGQPLIAKLQQRKVLKTVNEISIAIDDSERLMPAPPPPVETFSTQRPLPKPRKERVVPRTMLDHSILQELKDSSGNKQIELAKERLASGPIKTYTPIEADKTALPCPFEWSDRSKDKVRTCGNCQLLLYNFDGMERPQVESMIFQRESKKKFNLFKRADGKFMTADCPVALKRRREIMTLTVVVSLVILSLVLAMMFMPPPPQPASEPATAPDTATTTDSLAPSASQPGAESTPSTTTGATTEGATPGEFTYERGKGVTSRPQPVNTTPQTTTPAAPDPDENGQFWQYSGGPQDVQPVPDSGTPTPQTPQSTTAPGPAQQPAQSQSQTQSNTANPSGNPYVKNYNN